SIISVPPLTSQTFGLIQEELATDPFALLIACVLLNKTHASRGLPLFRSLIAHHPTPSSLASTSETSLALTLSALGLQNARARTLIALAQAWITNPPTRGRRYRTLDYPYRGAGRDIAPGEVLGDEEEDGREGAWEVGHLPGLGPYAWDSWRMFCRDRLRGVGEGVEEEWKRVRPGDKELKAFVGWMGEKE
ncbi:DNA glycosylase, partial [Trichodelitschia bisporula]